MRKILLALLFLVLSVGFVQADQLTVNNFNVDDSGRLNYRSQWEASTTSDTVAASESGKVFIVTMTTTPTYTLPTAATGLQYTFVATTGHANGSKKIIIDPQSTDTLVGCVNTLATTAFAAGDAIISPGATGDSITLVANSSSQWVCTNTKGTWVDNN